MYSYADMRPKLFTEEAQREFIKVRDNAKSMLEQTGAFMGYTPFKGASVGDTFMMSAMLDRMIELGDLFEVTGPDVWGQHRIFVDARKPH